jgi:hypothetical protein
MRNLFLSVIVLTICSPIAMAQSIKVIGNPGSQNNYITQFDGTYFTVGRNDGYAVVDLSGKTVYSGIKAPVIGMFRSLPLYHNLLFADEGGKTVLKTATGQTLGIEKFSEVTPFTTDNTISRIPTPQGFGTIIYIDTTGKVIARLEKKKYDALMQVTGKPVLSPFASLSSFTPFSEGLTPVISPLTNKYGYMDKKLELAISPTYKHVRPFSEGLAAVQDDNGNWGYINKSGKLVIPFTYSLPPSRFASGLAKVETKDAKYGYINKSNGLVIQPKYQYATHFYKGYALVRENYSQPIALIDTTGTVVATFPKDLIYLDNAAPGAGIFGGDQPEYPFYVSETLRSLIDEGKGIFQKGTSYGLYDNRGNLALDFKFTHLSDYHNGKMFAHYYAYVNNKPMNQYGIIDDKGNWIIEITPSQF